MSSTGLRIARVAVPLPLEETFHYLIPAEMTEEVTPGSRVRIRFGTRSLTGVVVALEPAGEAPATGRLRPIDAVADPSTRLPPDLLELGRVVAEHYLAGIGEVLASALPPVGAARRRARKPEPPPAPPAAGEPRLRLSAPQREAVTAIVSCLSRGTFEPFLLHGVTGSGKTEVYLRAIEEGLRRGRGSLYLVPEIGLTALLAARCRARLGPEVAVLHSGLPAAARRAEWERVARGEARVVLGARSAVFAPVRDLGLVVVDEEQEATFKQEERPRYHARDVALLRAQACGAAAVLGSATPSVESFHRARQGAYRMLTLPARIADRGMAAAEIVDMREEFRRRGRAEPLSEALLAALREALGRGEQAILLLNRRGYAPSLLCRECGEIPGCRRCSVPLSVHRAAAKLRCHYCGYWRGLPDRCPACDGERLEAAGEGTERLEEALRELLPSARLARLDRDTARRRGEAGRLLKRFSVGDADILLGTQMVAKGHDFPRVTVVGVLRAEGGLRLPDFRAAERTFSLLTQVAGRAGRGAAAGRVLLQTFNPDHYAIRFAAAQDYAAFFEAEIRFRRLLQYPPFTFLANLVVAQRSEALAHRQAEALAAEVERRGAGYLRVLGPAPSPLSRLRGAHRVQILVKGKSRGRLRAAIRDALAAVEPGGPSRRHVAVDIDPASLV